MKLVFLKILSNKNWSDAIDCLAQEFSVLCHEHDIEFKLIELSGVSLRNIFLIAHVEQRKDIIYVVNHSMCLWNLLFAKLLTCRVRGGRVYSLSHEGEVKFSFRDKMAVKGVRKKIGNLIRGAWLYHSIPQLISHKTYFLSELYVGSIFTRNALSVNFLGSKLNHAFIRPGFTDYNTFGEGSFSVVFPHDISRPDKGFGFFKKTSINDKVKVFYPVNCKHSDMINLYGLSDVVVIPTISYETYSLALVEALSLNKIIFASSRMGLANTLYNKYGYHRLKDDGIFISDVANFENVFLEMLNFIGSGGVSNSKYYYTKEKLDPKSASKMLFNDIMGSI
ncbi:glycosyltransferase [Shewanella sp. 10B]|uniref:glycosyltransferase n=1 Tax=Shewanella sp. 10B TaxID=2943322 RepID=UPI00201B2ED0|nr:glycosyltransferase [Shewanella sp. 10B]